MSLLHVHQPFDGSTGEFVLSGAADMVEEEEEEEEGAHMAGDLGEGMSERGGNDEEDMDIEQHVNGS